MGMPTDAILKMTPAEQKLRALTTLPTILKKMATKEIVSDILIKLATTPEDVFPAFLLSDGFQKCLDEKASTDKEPAAIYYRSRIRIRKQDGSKQDTQTRAMLTQEWLQAAKELIKAKKHPAYHHSETAGLSSGWNPN